MNLTGCALGYVLNVIECGCAKCENKIYVRMGRANRSIMLGRSYAGRVCSAQMSPQTPQCATQKRANG